MLCDYLLEKVCSFIVFVYWMRYFWFISGHQSLIVLSLKTTTVFAKCEAIQTVQIKTKVDTCYLVSFLDPEINSGWQVGWNSGWH